MIHVAGFGSPFKGMAWLVLNMKTNDGVPIKTFQSEGGEPIGKNEWRNSVYILNKEVFYIYQMLRRIEKHTMSKSDAHLVSLGKMSVSL